MSIASDFHRASRDRLANSHERQTVRKATATYASKVAETKASFLDWNYGREVTKMRKWEAVEHLDDYLTQFEHKASARGTQVHWAENTEQAQDIILEICRKHKVHRVVKSKSMATEEIHLNEFLENHGITPIESDLGEYIAQLRGEPPYHIVTPVMQLTKGDIDQTFHEKLKTPLGSTAEELTMTARKVLRQEYLTADMGITGANFIVAETGMVSITENEGNARLSSGLPKVVVTICGLEKVVPLIEDLGLFLPMLAVSGTGQQLTCYNTMLGGPRQPGELDGPEEFHVILLDNGRTHLLADSEQREALHCIRCGACLNACPIFKNVGGFAYNTTYQGPVGSVITPHLKDLSDWKHLSYASSLCGGCTEVCPVHINLHHHLLQNRRNAVKSGFGFWGEYLAFQIWSFFNQSKPAYEFSVKAARLGLRLSKFFGLEGSILDPARNWTKRRTLPEVPTQTFRDWWKQRTTTV